MMWKFLQWLFGFERIGELDGIDDPHDPQRITRIYYGINIETGAFYEADNRSTDG